MNIKHVFLLLSFSFISVFASAQYTTETQAILDAIYGNSLLIETQREGHTYQGNVYFVDPVNGASYASGARGGRSDPLASVQDCHDNLITDANHDVLFLLAGAVSGRTTLVEDVVITKDYFFIRGPGRDFIWTRSGNGDTISCTGEGVEFSGFQLETAGTGAGHGIQITDADFVRISHLWINETQGDGVNILRGDHAQICSNHFEGSGQTGVGQGVHIIGTAGASSENFISDNVFSEVQGDAIRIEQGTSLHTHITDNEIHDSDGWGINIGGSSVNALVTRNVVGNNASGNILDAGTGTLLVNNVEWAKHSIATEARLAELDAGNLPADVADVPSDVWDELLTGAAHNIPTSSGRRLRQVSEIISYSGVVVSATSNTVTLDTNAPVSAGSLDGSEVQIVVDGAAEGQTGFILDYLEGRVCVLAKDWKFIPGPGASYQIRSGSGRGTTNEGFAQGGTTNTIILNLLASTTDGIYHGQTVRLLSGPGQDQVGTIIDDPTSASFNGSTMVATLREAWLIIPTSTTAYQLEGDHASPTVEEMWEAPTRTLTAFDLAAKDIWEYTTRTVTGFYSLGLNAYSDIVTWDGNVVADVRVWATRRTLSGPQPDPDYGPNIFSLDYTNTEGEFTLFLPDGYFNVYVYKQNVSFPTTPEEITLP